MAPSSSTKRTLTEALRSPELDAAAAAFVRGAPCVADTSAVAEAPNGTDAVGDSQQSPVNQVTNSGSGTTVQWTGPASALPGKVSLSVRIPAELAHRLAGAAAARRLSRTPPLSQQEIVVQAVGEWLKRNA